MIFVSQEIYDLFVTFFTRIKDAKNFSSYSSWKLTFDDRGPSEAEDYNFSFILVQLRAAQNSWALSV